MARARRRAIDQLPPSSGMITGNVAPMMTRTRKSAATSIANPPATASPVLSPSCRARVAPAKAGSRAGAGREPVARAAIARGAVEPSATASTVRADTRLARLGPAGRQPGCRAVDHGQSAAIVAPMLTAERLVVPARIAGASAGTRR